MLLACKDVDAIKGSEEGITPSRVACGFGHEYIFDLLSGYEDRTPDMTTQDKDPFDDVNLKQNLDRSVILPLEDSIPATRISSASKVKKIAYSVEYSGDKNQQLLI